MNREDRVDKMFKGILEVLEKLRRRIAALEDRELLETESCEMAKRIEALEQQGKEANRRCKALHTISRRFPGANK